jgi:hypothetical protein
VQLVNVQGIGIITMAQYQVLLARTQQQNLQGAGQLAATQAARRPGSAGATGPAAAAAAAATAAAAGKKPGTPAGALTSAGSAGSLSLLERQAQQQRQGVPGAQMPITAAQLGQQRPQGPAAYALQAAGIRPGMYGQQGMPGVRPAGSVVPNSISHEVQVHLASLKPGEAPKVAAPDGYEWVLCASRQGTGPAWYALPRAAAAAHNAQVRRLCSGMIQGGLASRGS